jgi:hypothetical protein
MYIKEGKKTTGNVWVTLKCVGNMWKLNVFTQCDGRWKPKRATHPLMKERATVSAVISGIGKALSQ